MPSYYDENSKNWYCIFYFTDWTGTRKQKKKRGFARKKDAQEWERDFLARQSVNPGMKFASMAELYLQDKQEHTKQITYQTKKNRIEKWILPYFQDQQVDKITAANIRAWQGEIKNAHGANGKPLSPGYLQNIVTELSGIFNFAVRFYGLTVNPCVVAGNTVGKKQKSLSFWTKADFDKFIDTFQTSDERYTAFMVLYYTGMRIGELQALTLADLDFKKGMIHINKTYHIIAGKPVITPPKTAKSTRDIFIPKFLIDCLKGYIGRLYKPQQETRLFDLSRSAYASALKQHTEQAGLKQIRVHDLRHSHASLLIELGFSALLVSERLGHESVSTTLNIYSHLFPSRQSEVVDKLERLYNEGK